jgi:hypothetical protein
MSLQTSVDSIFDALRRAVQGRHHDVIVRRAAESLIVLRARHPTKNVLEVIVARIRTKIKALPDNLQRADMLVAFNLSNENLVAKTIPPTVTFVKTPLITPEITLAELFHIGEQLILPTPKMIMKDLSYRTAFCTMVGIEILTGRLPMGLVETGRFEPSQGCNAFAYHIKQPKRSKILYPPECIIVLGSLRITEIQDRLSAVKRSFQLSGNRESKVFDPILEATIRRTCSEHLTAKLIRIAYALICWEKYGEASGLPIHLFTNALMHGELTRDTDLRQVLHMERGDLEIPVKPFVANWWGDYVRDQQLARMSMASRDKLTNRYHKKKR